jgi:hypothetical protein
MSGDKIIENLEKIVDQAQERLDLETAQNPALQKAIHIVETFLRRRGRVCYGGQAINAHLPEKDKFYDPNVSLPDYDFFTPDAKADTDEIVDELKKAGFTEIAKRIGIHEGTTKIYVNYAAIADVTGVVPEFYEPIAKRSDVYEGIHYVDPIFLRMLMYLEISRPRGQVARWTKVYERLQLLERAKPLPYCTKRKATIFEDEQSARARVYLVKYMITNRRVFMGADIHEIYKQSGLGKSAGSRTHFLLKGSAPVVFLSPDAEHDAEQIMKVMRVRKVSIQGYQNYLPPMVALYKGENIVCLIVQQEACHSHVVLPLTKHRQLRVASMDTLLTFLISLYYREDSLLMTKEALLCWIREYTKIMERYRHHPTSMFPAFSIECTGYQTSFASLLRAKAARIEAERQMISSGVRMTRRKVVKQGSAKRRTIKSRE